MYMSAATMLDNSVRAFTLLRFSPSGTVGHVNCVTNLSILPLPLLSRFLPRTCPNLRIMYKPPGEYLSSIPNSSEPFGHLNTCICYSSLMVSFAHTQYLLLYGVKPLQHSDLGCSSSYLSEYTHHSWSF